MSRRRRENGDSQTFFTPHDARQIQHALAMSHVEGVLEVAETFARNRNKNFKQLYASGFGRLRRLIEIAKSTKAFTALALWTLLAEHCNRQNAVAASQDCLAKHLGISKKSVARACKTLEELRALRRIPSPGGEHIYCLNPEDVWSGTNPEKSSAPFRTGKLARPRNDGTSKSWVVRLEPPKRPAPVEARSADPEDPLSALNP